MTITEILKAANHQEHLWSEYFLNKAVKLFSLELFQNVKNCSVTLAVAVTISSKTYDSISLSFASFDWMYFAILFLIGILAYSS